MKQLDYSLVLFPHSRPSMIVPLFFDAGEPLTIEDVSESTNAIFSDLTQEERAVTLSHWA